MKMAVSMGCVLACAFAAQAQMTATLTRLPNGREEIRVRNDGPSDLVAIAVYASQTSRFENSGATPYVAYLDSLEPDTEPLRSKQELQVLARRPLPVGSRLLEEPIVTAGILDDGTSVGDRALLNRLLTRRCNLLLAVETTLDTLLGAGSRNIPKLQLVARFQEMANTLNRWYVPLEQQAARSLYQSMAGKLLNLPDGAPGSAFPPAEFVEREAALLSRQRAQLLESQPTLAAAAVLPK